MKEQRPVILLVLFVVALGTGLFGTSLLTEAEPDESFQLFENFTANHEENIKQVSFDNRSIDLLYEDSERAKMYLDLDQDGSFDRELNVTNDGEERELEEVVTLRDKSYRLYIRYMDSGNATEDGYMTVYRIEEIQ